MKKQTKGLIKRLAVGELVVAGILLIPFLTKAPWTGSDYLFAGVVLSICSLIYVFVTRNMKNNLHKLGVAAVILFFILLVIGWAATGPANEAILAQ